MRSMCAAYLTLHFVAALCSEAAQATASDLFGHAVVPRAPDIVLHEVSRFDAMNVNVVRTGTIFVVREERDGWLRVSGGWVREIDVIDCDLAMEFLTEAITRTPDIFSYVTRSRVADYLGNFRAAEADATQAIGLNKSAPLAYVARGTARWHLGDLNSAIKDFNAAIALAPNDVDAYYGRGCALIDAGKYEEALEDFARALSMNRRHQSSYSASAYCNVMLRHYKQAIVDLDKALQLDPGDEVSWTNRGGILTKVGDHEAAVSDLDKAIRLKPDNAEAFNTRGFAKTALSHLSEARRDFDKAIQLSPRYWEAYNNRGIVWRKTGKMDLAIADFARAIELAPRHVGPYRNRAGTYLAVGEYALALKDCESLATLVPDDPRNLACWAWIMATCPVDKYRDGARAVAFARKSCQISNWQDAWFIMVLAAAYAEAGDFRNAIRWQERGIEIEQDEYGIRAMKELLELYRSGSSYRRKPAWSILSKLLGEFA